jgi:hypothetical protein
LSQTLPRKRRETGRSSPYRDGAFELKRPRPGWAPSRVFPRRLCGVRPSQAKPTEELSRSRSRRGDAGRVRSAGLADAL